MTATINHEPGTADFVTELTYTRTVQRYGFTAYLVIDGDQGSIYLSAMRWKGRQPRLVLHHWSDGYADWKALLMSQPAVVGHLRFVGAATASRMPDDQWITHGPSPLL